MIIKNIFSFLRAPANRRFVAPLWFVFFLFIFSFILNAQVSDDSQAAQRYVQWIKQAIENENWAEAQTGLSRGLDFETVSSDLSFLNALFLIKNASSPVAVIYYLDRAIDTDRWIEYEKNRALLLKANQLIIIRDYYKALDCLDQIKNAAEQMRADAAYFRLLAYRGMSSGGRTGFTAGYNSVQSLRQFRSLVLTTMDAFPRDSRPLRVFLEYALSSLHDTRNRKPSPSAGIFAGNSDLLEGDLSLMELILRRLPFLLENDPELAWMAAPFIRDINEARRLVASYRSGGIPGVQNRDFKPHPESIPAALNLGLLDDIEACEELFSGGVSHNNPVSLYFKPNGNPVLNSDVITRAFNLLRSEEGRDFFTQKLLSFTGIIYADEDNDGYFDSFAQYESGIIKLFEYDTEQKYASDFLIFFDDGIPDYAIIRVTGQSINAHVNWERVSSAARYPFVDQVILGNPISKPNEIIKFGPAVYQYAPVSFITLGGSNKREGIFFPVPDYRHIEFSYRTLVLNCSSITRSSPEIHRAEEIFYMNRGIIQKAAEFINQESISITDFEKGYPVIQHIDLDQDGRMETIRRFRRPPPDTDRQELLNYRNFIESSESDWRGDGKFKTKEVYLENGTVVYYFDMDGSGQWTQSETGNRK